MALHAHVTFTRSGTPNTIVAGTLLALFMLMSRLARIRNRTEYFGADLVVEVIEPGSTPMADARARAAALELLHAGDAQRSDLVLPALDPAIDARARTDERRHQDARTT